jgi:hypothetical protein
MAKPSLKSLQQRLRLTFAIYADLADATCEMMMTFKSIPLTTKSRGMVLIQKQYEDTAQAAYMKARPVYEQRFLLAGLFRHQYGDTRGFRRRHIPSSDARFGIQQINQTAPKTQ